MMMTLALASAAMFTVFMLFLLSVADRAFDS